ncbi:WGxxGxxG family protein [Bacillus sp. T33-2]|uniref:WGxxGxxG family protein n=1 Tax=Bacillus sp. T33-2 TaxID=2054168 RepID=UPI000C76FECE|nr:WGxxGxxG family protein [Bacillus sp. T33-2]PLR94805.1 hypothetical protein CVD19_16160 [Bacillus sp. T33-2]
MTKKLLYSFCALSLTTMLLGLAVHAHNSSSETNANVVTQIAQGGDNGNGDDMDMGWIGLLGLAGLLGLRKKNNNNSK